jgi:hypothetical protein
MLRASTGRPRRVRAGMRLTPGEELLVSGEHGVNELIEDISAAHRETVRKQRPWLFAIQPRDTGRRTRACGPLSQAYRLLSGRNQQ